MSFLSMKQILEAFKGQNRALPIIADTMSVRPRRTLLILSSLTGPPPAKAIFPLAASGGVC
jgi:hypothetical protein